jgi:hypothetical protein
MRGILSPSEGGLFIKTLSHCFLIDLLIHSCAGHPVSSELANGVTAEVGFLAAPK